LWLFLAHRSALRDLLVLMALILLSPDLMAQAPTRLLLQTVSWVQSQLGLLLWLAQTELILLSLGQLVQMVLTLLCQDLLVQMVQILLSLVQLVTALTRLQLQTVSLEQKLSGLPR
jgi:hypothetical protein